MPTLRVEPGLLELLASSAAEAERGTALTPDSVDALAQAGVFTALIPAGLGGGEAHPLELRSAIEQIATADGAAGWCAAICATAGLAAAYLPEGAAKKLFGGQGVIPAGVFAPLGRLGPSDAGDLELSGRWPLGSAVSFATVVGLGGIHPEHGPRYVLVPRDAVEVVDTWDSLGLRATASHDVTVAAVVVPEEHIIDLIGGDPVGEGPLYAFPLFGLLAICVSAVCTGIASGALADVTAIATERKPVGSSRTLAERATAQERVAAATAALRAARAGVSAAIEGAWSAAIGGEPLGVSDRAGLRLAATHAARTAVEVVDACHRLGGARALYRGNALERRLRDVHTAAQHMVVAPATSELAGRVLLGIDTDTSQL